MQTYAVRLESPVTDSFRCNMAANSVDLDVSKKSVHELTIKADLDTPWSVGLIVGASGSGKTSLAKTIFGADCMNATYDLTKPVIEQFPSAWTYDQCQAALNGIGLTQVPCWVRPMHTLSNGQQSRAIAALQMAANANFVVDEWTSVVDRTVAKAMSHCLQKHARNTKTSVCAVSCHYDVIEWLNPDWIIDCNRGEYIDRRLLRLSRTEQLQFDVRECDSRSWRFFSQYHYLSETLPGGHVKYFGLYHRDMQIGFIGYANYTPHRAGTKMKMHFNRLVVHPDYVGLGLGMKLIEATAAIMLAHGYEVWGKFSSTPVARALAKSADWKLIDIKRFTPMGGTNMKRKGGFRQAVKTYSYFYAPVVV